jgi:hypothetical protein
MKVLYSTYVSVYQHLSVRTSIDQFPTCRLNSSLAACSSWNVDAGRHITNIIFVVICRDLTQDKTKHRSNENNLFSDMADLWQPILVSRH